MSVPDGAFGTVVPPRERRALADLQRRFADGIYVPTLTGMAVGAGSNVAQWSFSNGQLHVEGRAVFGAGATFPTSPLCVSLPPGFSLVNTDEEFTIGKVSFRDVGTATYDGVVRPQTATTVRLMTLLVSATYPTHVAPSTTIPFTWVSGDYINYQFGALVTRP